MKLLFIALILFAANLIAQECPVKKEHAVRWVATISEKDTSEFIYTDNEIIQIRYKERILGGTCRYCQEKLTRYTIEAQDTIYIKREDE